MAAPAHGFTYQADYTWSKALDTTDCCSGNIYNYEIPFLRNQTNLAGKLLGGWQLSGITTFQIGLPIDPVLNTDQPGVGSAARQRPQIVGTPVLGRGQRVVTEWFNPANYVLRADAFNPWNHTEFDTVGISYAVPSEFAAYMVAG